MTKFKKGGFRQGGGNSGGRPKFGGKFGGGRDRGGRSGGRLELFPVVCSECRKNCEVPFRPTGDKPVYCRECFDKQKHVPGRNSNGMDRSSGDFRGDVRPPREYQNEDVEAQGDAAIEELNQHLAELELKVNRILELVSKKTENSVPVISVVEKTPKAKAKKKVGKK